jgi:MarR family transcriptional regulator, lower aerobic nicotinate degradation pathway regulator
MSTRLSGMTARPPHPTTGEASAATDRLDIVDGLVQLSFLIQAILAEVAADHDLSISQVRLLGILRDRDVEMLPLAAHLGLDKSSVTGLVTRAERRDLVRRMPSPRDRRAVLVTLTPHGRRLTRDAEDRVRRRVHTLTAGLSAAEQDTLVALAARILGA